MGSRRCERGGARGRVEPLSSSVEQIEHLVVALVLQEVHARADVGAVLAGGDVRERERAVARVHAVAVGPPVAAGSPRHCSEAAA